MAKTIYPEELTALLEEFLADGIISTKERLVLLNKAQSLGIDVEEFDLYINAQQQKAGQRVAAEAAKKRGKTCPFCGAPVPQLADKCPECEQFITPEASEELQEIFEHLEEALVDFKSGKDIERSKANVERYVRKAKVYYENNPKVKKLLAEIEIESDAAETKAKKNARNKTIVSILTYNINLTIGVAVAIILFLWWGISTIIPKSIVPIDLKDDPQATIEAVINAINNGELLMAESYCAAYVQNHRSVDIKSAYTAIAKEYSNQGNFSKALELAKIVGSLGGERASGADPVRIEIQNKCIEKGDYDMAEKCLDYYGSTDVHYDFLCKCIDRMKETGNDSKIKSFIDRKTARYDSYLTHQKEWQQEAVKKRLYEYAGIK